MKLKSLEKILLNIKNKILRLTNAIKAFNRDPKKNCDEKNELFDCPTLNPTVLLGFQLFIGFGFPYEGPAPLEAIANGCIFLQPKFRPPHSSLNHEFFRGKPTSREVTPTPEALWLASYKL